MNVSLCREDGVYEAGGELLAKWRIRRVSVDDIQSVEVSVMWHTEGKGDEDLHVHHFHRVGESQVRRRGLADQQSFRCRLPASPLSYHGHLIHLRWCLRLRLFLIDGREILAEQPFHLVAPGAYPVCGVASEKKFVTRRMSPSTKTPKHTKATKSIKARIIKAASPNTSSDAVSPG